jgi:hypothetical protein
MPGMDAPLDGYGLFPDSRILAGKDVETEPRGRWNAVILLVINDSKFSTSSPRHSVFACNPHKTATAPPRLRSPKAKTTGPYAFVRAATGGPDGACCSRRLSGFLGWRRAASGRARRLITCEAKPNQRHMQQGGLEALSGARYLHAFLRETPIAIMVEDGTAALLRQPALHWPSADR